MTEQAMLTENDLNSYQIQIQYGALVSLSWNAGLVSGYAAYFWLTYIFYSLKACDADWHNKDFTCEHNIPHKPIKC